MALASQLLGSAATQLASSWGSIREPGNLKSKGKGEQATEGHKGTGVAARGVKRKRDLHFVWWAKVKLVSALQDAVVATKGNCGAVCQWVICLHWCLVLCNAQNGHHPQVQEQEEVAYNCAVWLHALTQGWVICDL
eukprot:scaffold24319_cov14-Tisochrysis_lutea.AAC.1